MNENKPAPWLRFRDLQALRIVGNRVQLARLQRLHGFPSGKLISENTVIFSQQAVEDWLASRPDARSEGPRSGAG